MGDAGGASSGLRGGYPRGKAGTLSALLLLLAAAGAMLEGGGAAGLCSSGACNACRLVSWRVLSVVSTVNTPFPTEAGHYGINKSRVSRIHKLALGLVSVALREHGTTCSATSSAGLKGAGAAGTLPAPPGLLTGSPPNQHGCYHCH